MDLQVGFKAGRPVRLGSKARALESPLTGYGLSWGYKRDISPRNQRALTLLGLLLECSLILFALGQNPNLGYIGVILG